MAQLRDLPKKRLNYAGNDGENFLDVVQNARLITAAERYYRIMYYGGSKSWNLRDTHMFETLGHLLAAWGPGSKAILGAQLSYRRRPLCRNGCCTRSAEYRPAMPPTVR